MNDCNCSKKGESSLECNGFFRSEIDSACLCVCHVAWYQRIARQKREEAEKKIKGEKKDD